MAGMEQDLAEYEEGIKRATAEKERIRTEHFLPSRIGRSLNSLHPWIRPRKSAAISTISF